MSPADGPESSQAVCTPVYGISEGSGSSDLVLFSAMSETVFSCDWGCGLESGVPQLRRSTGPSDFRVDRPRCPRPETSAALPDLEILMPNEISMAAPTALPNAGELRATTPGDVSVGAADQPEQHSGVPEDGSTAGPAAVAIANAPPAEPAKAGAAPLVAAGLSYAVDIVFCIDVTGSMTPILDAVKANALRFYDDVQANLTDKGKNVDQLRVRIIAFRDFAADPASALQESSFFLLPDERTIFSSFVDGLVAEGGGDAPESGLEAVALAINSPWTSNGDRRRQVIVVWTDQPAHTLNFAVLPPDLASSVPTDFDIRGGWKQTPFRDASRLAPAGSRLPAGAPFGGFPDPRRTGNQPRCYRRLTGKCHAGR